METKIHQNIIKKITWKHIFVFIAVAVFYILLFVLYQKSEARILMFALFPVLLQALFFGLKAALLLQTLNVFLITFFLSVFQLEDEAPIEILKNGMIGITMHYIIISLVGFMRDQQYKIKELNIKITQLSKIDDLTKLYNRRAILDEFNREFLRTTRSFEDLSYFMDLDPDNKSLPHHNKDNAEFKKKRNINDYFGVFTCAILDIDSFKKINDNYGHLVGDDVLVQFADILKQDGVLRKTDFSGRYGGEEFLLLFPGTSSRNSYFVLERIKTIINKTEFHSNSMKTFFITFSAGISQYQKRDKDIFVIIERADQALYQAKKQGKNCIVIYEHGVKKGESS